MARKKSVSTLIKAIARDAARASRQAETNRKKAIRAQEAQRKAVERQKREAEIGARRRAAQVERERKQKELEARRRVAQTEKERKQLELEARQLEAQAEKERKQLEAETKEQYLTMRLEETDELNTNLAERNEQLKTILEHTLGVDDTIVFNSLRVKDEFPSFIPPQELVATITPPDKNRYLKQVKPMGFVENALGMKGRYQREMQTAVAQYQNAVKAYEIAEGEKKAKLEQLQAEYETNRNAFLQKVQQRDQEVSELEAAYSEGDGSAIITYATMVLERSEYPDGFPQSFRLAYVPESKEMVIEYELPWVDVIPAVVEYKYNKTKDTVDEKPRKPTEIKELYQDIVAAIALRTIHEVLESDQGNHIQVITYNGMTSTVDPATGKDIHPCLVSVRTTKDSFMDLNLSRIDKRVCLRNLGAQVSSNPSERQPVKPIVEFNMVDKRFIEQGDVLSELDSRPNLMDLNPGEFEHLVSNLFGKMGLETKLTRSSKDGGVDAVAFDTRPILGGKVVIQAKRYKNTVGVSAVRDLYGTMLNEGASKGIIVTTSSYGPDAHEFSKDKPLELIDGGGLLYLLEQVGIKAKIVMPQE